MAPDAGAETGTRRGGSRSGGGMSASSLVVWELVLFFAVLPPPMASGAAPSSNTDCAMMVPLEELRRGKGAFLSGCSTLSESNLGGCWTQTENIDTDGCQTCYIAEDAFADALFPVMFSEELDPCPTSVDYASLYEEEHGPLDLVTAASVTSGSCPEGWLYSSTTGGCYFKSPNTEKSADQPDAASKCEAEGAWLIAIDSEEENSFLVHNMLWIGFFGETYTGLKKADSSDEWAWPEDAAGVSSEYDCLQDYSDWIEGPDLGCASEYNDGVEGTSCMEIFPYEPKGWNPFSCLVGKHYVCEMSSSSSGSTSTSTTSMSPAPSASEPTSIPSTSPATTTKPTNRPTVDPTPKPTVEPTTVEPTEAPTSGKPTVAPSTVVPTVAPSTTKPTVAPSTPKPTVAPSIVEPTEAPRTVERTISPGTPKPTVAPSTVEPTEAPRTVEPTISPGTEKTTAAPVPPTTESTELPTDAPSAAAVGTETPAPSSLVGEFETEAPTTIVATPSGDATPTPTATTQAPTTVAFDSEDWEGFNTLIVTKTGQWAGAEYSLYLVEGEEEFPVVESVTKKGTGSGATDAYDVKTGCYRIEVTSGADPTQVSWDISGGHPARPGDQTSGNGLQGALLTVGGGVCGVGSCQAECLADYFSSSSEVNGGSPSSNACDGFAALIEGVCSDLCVKEDGEDTVAFQDKCLAASCDPEEVCAMELDTEAGNLRAEHSLQLDVLLVVRGSAAVGSSTSSSNKGADSEKEFEASVALWLGVDKGTISVTAVNGVEIVRGENNASSGTPTSSSPSTGESSSRRLQDAGRALQDGGVSPSGTSSATSAEKEYTRFDCSVAPDGASESEVTQLQNTATASDSTDTLEAWLNENGGAWAEATVLETEGQVLETIHFVRDPPAEASGGGGSWFGDNPARSGGIIAAAVVVVAVTVTVAFVVVRRKRRQPSRRKVRQSETGGVLTRQYESSTHNLVSSDANRRAGSRGVNDRRASLGYKPFPSNGTASSRTASNGPPAHGFPYTSSLSEAQAMAVLVDDGSGLPRAPYNSSVDYHIADTAGGGNANGGDEYDDGVGGGVVRSVGSVAGASSYSEESAAGVESLRDGSAFAPTARLERITPTRGILVRTSSATRVGPASASSSKPRRASETSLSGGATIDAVDYVDSESGSDGDGWDGSEYASIAGMSEAASRFGAGALTNDRARTKPHGNADAVSRPPSYSIPDTALNSPDREWARHPAYPIEGGQPQHCKKEHVSRASGTRNTSNSSSRREGVDGNVGVASDRHKLQPPVSSHGRFPSTSSFGANDSDAGSNAVWGRGEFAAGEVGFSLSESRTRPSTQQQRHQQLRAESPTPSESWNGDGDSWGGITPGASTVMEDDSDGESDFYADLGRYQHRGFS